jgi:hypothetical protein
MLTIVMSHRVRELKRSRYPEIKGLELSLFREQIEYVRRHHHPSVHPGGDKTRPYDGSLIRIHM